MIGPDDERRRSGGEGFGDSVTFSFGDLEADVFGLARLGLQPAASTASALAVVFSGGAAVAATARGGVEAPEGDWEALSVAGLTGEVVSPLREWRLALEAEGGGFDLRFHAATGPIEVDDDDEAARAGGLTGYSQLCRVEGTVDTGGGRRSLSCLGQRDRAWGVVDWERMELARTVSAWWDERQALALTAIRPAGARSHADEAVSARLVEEIDGEAVAIAVANPRLSTTYDGEGRQRRAGLELWLGEDDEVPRRVGGRVTCGTSLDLGRLRLDCAFFEWRSLGRAGAGRYDVLRLA
jgi:hypothetical protein